MEEYKIANLEDLLKFGKEINKIKRIIISKREEIKRKLEKSNPIKSERIKTR